MAEQAQAPRGGLENHIHDTQRVIASLGIGETIETHTKDDATLRAFPPIAHLPEWNMLVADQMHVTPGASGSGDSVVELKRTGLSVACVLDVYNNDKKRFPDISDTDWRQLQEQVKHTIPDADTLHTFLLLLVTHDSGKNPDICRAVDAGPDMDHDEVYSRLVTDPAYVAARRQYMPSFDLLTANGRRLLTDVARLRTNYPQSLQGEAPADTLRDFHNEPDPQVKALDILKAKFDIFGAAGHVTSEASLTATSATLRRMYNLDMALLRDDLDTPQARNNAFLDAEITHFMGHAEPYDEQQQTEWRALARLECTLRVNTYEDFARLRTAFDGLADISKTVLVNELNRSTRATLAYYSPVLLRTLVQRNGTKFALEYFAHILQEAHIADQEARANGGTGVSVVQAEALVRDITDGTFDPATSSVRFLPVEGALVATKVEVAIHDLAGLPAFINGEDLRGKRALFVGEGGGSDGLQAAMVARVFASKYGCETAAVVSTRNAAREITGSGETIGKVTKRITPNTTSIGNWRFLEKIPLEDDPNTPMYLLNSTEGTVVASDMAELVAHTGAQVVIGVDTGGDSLYRSEHPSFSAHLPTDITPDHDYSVIGGLAKLAEANPQLDVRSVIVAPGVDSPLYGREMLDTINANQVPLTDSDVATIKNTYARWRMDGSGSEEGRYGKTPLAWLHALRGRTGFQRLDLPKADAISDINPWRAFTVITPAMAGVVIADLQQHFNAIRRGM